MRKLALFFSTISLPPSSSAVVAAGDFEWLKDLNIRVEADSSGEYVIRQYEARKN